MDIYYLYRLASFKSIKFKESQWLIKTINKRQIVLTIADDAESQQDDPVGDHLEDRVGCHPRQRRCIYRCTCATNSGDDGTEASAVTACDAKRRGARVVLPFTCDAHVRICTRDSAMTHVRASPSLCLARNTRVLRTNFDFWSLPDQVELPVISLTDQSM